jgi:hypothetical protein
LLTEETPRRTPAILPILPYDTYADVSLLELIRQVLLWVRERLLWLLLAIVLGCGVGAYLFYTTPPLFTSRFVAYANDLDDFQVREVVSDLMQLRAENNIQELAKRMSISEEVAASIHSLGVETTPMLEADLPAWVTREKSTYPFGLIIVSRSDKNFEAVQGGIEHYFDQHPFATIRLKKRQEGAKTRMDGYNAELTYMEGLKKTQDNMMNEGRGSLIDPGALSTHMVDLAEKRESLRLESATIAHEIVIIKPVLPSKKPSSPTLTRRLLLGGGLGLLAGLVAFGLIGVWNFTRK